MVDLRARERREVRGRVAGFARHAAARDVVARHAGRLHAVVAAGAIPGDALVGEHRPGPRQRRMAGVAFQVRNDMVWRLAGRHDAVVAGRAATPCLRMIEVDRRLERDGCMARAALVGRENMGRRLRGRPDRGADAVAGLALLGGALEYCVGMARLARQVAVLADELETGREVIKRGALGARGLRRQAAEGEQQCAEQRAQRRHPSHAAHGGWHGAHAASSPSRP